MDLKLVTNQLKMEGCKHVMSWQCFVISATTNLLRTKECFITAILNEDSSSLYLHPDHPPHLYLYPDNHPICMSMFILGQLILYQAFFRSWFDSIVTKWSLNTQTYVWQIQRQIQIKDKHTLWLTNSHPTTAVSIGPRATVHEGHNMQISSTNHESHFTTALSIGPN